MFLNWKLFFVQESIEIICESTFIFMSTNNKIWNITRRSYSLWIKDKRVKDFDNANSFDFGNLFQIYLWIFFWFWECNRIFMIKRIYNIVKEFDLENTSEGKLNFIEIYD